MVFDFVSLQNISACQGWKLWSHGRKEIDMGAPRVRHLSMFFELSPFPGLFPFFYILFHFTLLHISIFLILLVVLFVREPLALFFEAGLAAGEPLVTAACDSDASSVERIFLRSPALCLAPDHHPGPPHFQKCSLLSIVLISLFFPAFGCLFCRVFCVFRFWDLDLMRTS